MAWRPQDRRDRAKAMTAALAVTAVLGAGVIAGLNVDKVHDVVEHLRTLEINLPKPPPPPQPRLRPQPRNKPQAAPPAPKASPVVAPKPQVPLPPLQPVAAAQQPGTGASSSNGQGGAGNGTGSGRSGNGLGGGGGGNTPARLIRNLSRSDYRALTGGRMSAGSAGLAIGIAPNGRISSCRVEHSSGDPAIDSGLCSLVQARLVFAPARNAQGQPIGYFTHYLATWRR
jgi:protein TonB